MESNSKHREQPLGQFFRNVWYVKRVETYVGLLVCIVLAVLIQRSSSAPFQASIRMFAQMSRKGQSNTTSAVSIPEMERITFISSQEELLTSYPLYLKVRRNYTDGDWPTSTVKTEETNKPLSLFNRLKITENLNKIFFGKNSADNALEWNDNEYSAFIKKVSFEQKPSSGTFIISYQDPDPRRAVKVTKLISDALVELNYDIVNKKKSSLVQYLENKKVDAQQKVNETREEIAQFLKKNNYSDNERVIDAKLRLYNELMTGYRNDLIEKEAEEEGVSLTKKYVESTRKAIEGSMGDGKDQKILTLSNELNRLQNFKVRYENVYGLASEDYDLQIAAVKEKLAEIGNPGLPVSFEAKNTLLNQLRQLQLEREISLASKIKKLDATKSLKDKYEAEIKRFPELQAQLAQMLFENHQAQKKLEIISESLVSTSIQGDSELTQLFAIQEPMIVNPFLKKGLKLSLAILVLSGLFLISFGVLHFLKGTIFSKYDLMVPNLPRHYFLGSIPQQSKNTAGRLSRAFGGSDAILKDAQTLKHHLSLGEETEGTVVQFWSEKDASGKSVTTFAMALALKDLGHSVVVLDCDFRTEGTGLLRYAAREKNRRHITVLENLQSMTETLLSGDVSTSEITSKVIIASPIPASSQKKEAYRYFDTQFYTELTLLKKHFDFILLDAPPLSLGQGLLTSPLADAIVLCCPEGKITQSGYSEMLHYIESYCGEKTKILSLITMSKLKVNREAMEMGTRDRTLVRKIKVAA